MFECKVAEKKSKKGNTYVCLEVTFPNGYKKIVFLEKPEEYMVRELLS